jgi:hypothetical protein
MNLFMTRPVKTHQILFLVASAFRQRHDVMHLFGCHVSALLQALLAKRMLPNITVTDSLPGSAITFAG